MDKLSGLKKAKDYAFVHFNSREAAEKAYEATKDNLILDNCHVEVTWSKPIDRHIHSQRKQLSKALTSLNPASALMAEQHGSPPHIPVAVNPIFTPQPILQLPSGMSNLHGMRNSISPRPRGAAGIRGLGAPGTPPPRNLVRKLQATNSLSNHIMRESDLVEIMLKNQQLISDFAGLSLNSAYNGLIPPPGAPTSPNSNGQDFYGVGSGNLRMMAPPAMSGQSPPFYYYGVT